VEADIAPAYQTPCSCGFPDPSLLSGVIVVKAAVSNLTINLGPATAARY
jgi:hypothetical protein